MPRIEISPAIEKGWEAKVEVAGLEREVTFGSLIRTAEVYKVLYRWCEENCIGKYSSSPNNRVIYFENRADAYALKLAVVL